MVRASEGTPTPVAGDDGRGTRGSPWRGGRRRLRWARTLDLAGARPDPKALLAADAGDPPLLAIAILRPPSTVDRRDQPKGGGAILRLPSLTDGEQDGTARTYFAFPPNLPPPSFFQLPPLDAYRPHPLFHLRHSSHSIAALNRHPIPASGVVAAESDGRSVILGDSDLSYQLPGAPFEFQFSYSETPKAHPRASVYTSKVVTLLRLNPLLPFSLGNYLYGLTSVKFVPYVLGSWLGMLPGTWAYVSVGAFGPQRRE